MDLIDEKIIDYAEKISSKPHPVLIEIEEYTRKNTNAPQMLTGHLAGKYLNLICRLMNPAKVVEVGTFTGYSAISMALGMTHGAELHTLEKDSDKEELVMNFAKKAGVEDIIHIHIGDAREVLPKVTGVVDLAFLDAAKKDYEFYYETLFPHMPTGGMIIADNALWSGKVTDPQDETTEAIHSFNKMVSKDKRVENFILPIRDGIHMILVK